MATTTSIPNAPISQMTSLSDELQFFNEIMAEAGFFAEEDMVLPETEDFFLPSMAEDPYKHVTPPPSPHHEFSYSQDLAQVTSMAGFGSSSPTSVHQMLNPNDLKYTVPVQQYFPVYPAASPMSMTTHNHHQPLILPAAPVLVKPVETIPRTAVEGKGSTKRTKKTTPTKKATVSKTTSQKRRLSLTSTDSSSGSSSKRNYTPKQQVDRRERNRQHAKKSRSRKKCFTEELKISLQEIKQENKNIRTQLNDRFGKKLIDSMVVSRVGTPHERFLAALQKPEHRVVNHSTLSMLQSLSKDVSSKMAPSSSP